MSVTKQLCNTTTREGKYRLGIRTSKKKLKVKKQGAKAWLKTRLNKPVSETMKILTSVVRGHCNYYGVSGNFQCIQNYWKYLKYELLSIPTKRYHGSEKNIPVVQVDENYF